MKLIALIITLGIFWYIILSFTSRAIDHEVKTKTANKTVQEYLILKRLINI